MSLFIDRFRKAVVFISFFVMPLVLGAQVGVGEPDPSAALELNGQSVAMPALRLVPQTAPYGTAEGQLAVVNGILYKFDLVRNKWLSVETTILSFGLLGNADNQDLEFIGDVELGGPSMPFDGTVVYATATATGGNLNKVLFIEGFEGGTLINPVITQPIQYVNGSINNNQVNVDFDAGIYTNVRVSDFADTSSGLDGIENPVFTIWIKWRLDNGTP